MSTAGEALLSLFSIVLVCFIGWVVMRIRSDSTEEKTTATTEGLITLANYCRVDGDNSYFYHVRYYVKNVRYKLVQETDYITHSDLKKMKVHEGETVPVHYDPNDPRIAWAEVPGRSKLHHNHKAYPD